MPCVAVPHPPLPVLPDPLSISPPAVPDVPGVPNLCCKLPNPIPDVPPIPIPAQVLTGVTTVLNGYVDAVLAYLDALPPPCPRD